MELNVIASGNKVVSKVSVSDTTFGREFNEALVHQVVTAYLTNARQGTKAQKSRADVSGGGIKPWKQKGTGRARVGSSRSPIWRKGGVTFAARPRDFSQKVNRKMYDGAMRSIFSELVRQDRLIMVEDFAVTAPKTKDLVNKLKEFSCDNVLIVLHDFDENLYLSSRNLSHVGIIDVAGIDPVSLIGFEKVLMTVAAVKQVEEMFA